MPKKYFVTRHRGAVTWAARNGIKARKVSLGSFNPLLVQRGDVVIGTLPVQVIAQVNTRGGHYWHLSMDVPEEYRGAELTADQMSHFGAKLEEFYVSGLGRRLSAQPDVESSAADDCPRVHMCVATGQTLPNFLPILALPWTLVVIFASQKMLSNAKRLKALVDRVAVDRGLPGNSCVIVPLPEDLSFDSLKQFAARQAEERFGTDGRTAVDFNLTGGTKVMPLAFSEAFRSGSRRLYCNTEQRCIEVIDGIDQPSIPLDPGMLSLEGYLWAQGFCTTRMKTAEDSVWLDAVGSRRELTEFLLVTKLLKDVLLQSVSTTVGTSHAVHRPISQGSPRNILGWLHLIGAEAQIKRLPNNVVKKTFEPFVRITVSNNIDEAENWKRVLTRLRDAQVLDDIAIDKSEADATTFSWRFRDEDAATYLAGGYLEEHVFLAVHDLGLPSSQYGAGVGLATMDPEGRQSSDEINEVDVMLVWNNQMLVIECKAGAQLSRGKSQEILNKLDQLKDNVGGIMGHAWLVSAQKVFQSAAEEISTRASLHGLTILDGPHHVRSLRGRLRSAFLL